jgi:response regulator of citrate/malate metabolism
MNYWMRFGQAIIFQKFLLFFFAKAEKIAKAKAKGVNHYLVKPFGAERLMKVIEDCLDDKEW